jgi:hypothetical protein
LYDKEVMSHPWRKLGEKSIKKVAQFCFFFQLIFSFSICFSEKKTTIIIESKHQTVTHSTQKSHSTTAQNEEIANDNLAEESLRCAAINRFCSNLSEI